MDRKKEAREGKGGIIERLGKSLVPSSRHKQIRHLCKKAGFQDIPFYDVGVIFVLTLATALLWTVYLVFMTGLAYKGILFSIAVGSWICVFLELLIIALAFGISRFYLQIRTYSRVQKIEENLPVFLREFSTNLKAGREFVDALHDSINVELGPLNEDIVEMVTQIKTGHMIEHVLSEYSQMYDSYTINETFEIILDAYRGGGGLSELIDKIAGNLEVIHYLKRNAVASVSNYIIFVTIVSLIIAPLLFALSYNLLDLVQKLVARLFTSGSTSHLPSYLRPIDVDFEDFRLFSQIGVSIIAGSAAAIIGIIKKGNLKGASFLILTYIGISLVVLTVSQFLITQMFEVLFANA